MLYDQRDARFGALVHKNAGMETIATGLRWAEGPAYLAASKALIWSDIPNDRLMRWDETSSAVSVFESPCRNQNGHAVDPQGRLIACEHLSRSVTRYEHDGSRTTLADRYDGKRLNSPNDVVVKRDGTIWFTDPTYGIDSEYEGDKSPSEIGASNVYRIDPDGSVSLVVGDRVKPNGLAFSPDEALLYVADTGRSHVPGTPPAITAYPVNADNSLGAGKPLCEVDTGMIDGFRVDTEGNIWSSAGDGVHVFDAKGVLLGKILTGEVVANVVFGGRKRNRLFICATTTVRSIYVNAQGISPYA